MLASSIGVPGDAGDDCPRTPRGEAGILGLTIRGESVGLRGSVSVGSGARQAMHHDEGMCFVEVTIDSFSHSDATRAHDQYIVTNDRTENAAPHRGRQWKSVAESVRICGARSLWHDVGGRAFDTKSRMKMSSSRNWSGRKIRCARRGSNSRLTHLLNEPVSSHK